MMMSERLEELQVLLDHLSDEANLLHQAKLRRQIQRMFKEQEERVEELERKNKELEYASKHNGELNEFLQKRKLPPKNMLGRHVVDVVMDYAEKLEKENKGLKKFYDYWSELHGTGLDVANWHMNGDMEPFDNFFDSAEEELEQEK